MEEGTRRRDRLGISWERTILWVLQHLKSSLRPRVQGAARWAGLGSPAKHHGLFFFLQIPTKGSANPAVPAPRSAAGPWQEEAVHARRVETALFARFPAKSSSAGGCELSNSREPDSAPKSQFSLKPRSHPLQHTFTARSSPAPRLLLAFMGNNIYFHQQRHVKFSSKQANKQPEQ